MQTKETPDAVADIRITVQKVRLAAACQHLDAVIVYEARSREQGTTKAQP